MCDTVNPLSHDQETYSEIINDGFLNVVVVNIRKPKSEADDYLVAYINELETQHGTRVKKTAVR